MDKTQKSYQQKTKLSKEKFIQFYQAHKKRVWIVGIAILVVIIIVIVNIVNSIRHSMQVAVEEKRNFFINTQEDVLVDCKLQESESSLVCESTTLTGTYSDYETTTLKSDNFGLKDNNGSFEIQVHYYISESQYEKDNFDINSIEDEYSSSTRIYLYNKVLSREVASKTVTTRFKFSEQDKELVAKKHQDWQKHKAEEEEQRKQQEAEAAAKKAADDEAARKQQEESSRKEAEAAAKKEQAEKSEMSQDKLVQALDTCGDVFHAQTRISIASKLKYIENSYWSGEDYQQFINIKDTDKGVHVVCKYNWQNNTAVITSWNYL